MHFIGLLLKFLGFSGGEVEKNLPANAGDARDTDSIPRSGRSPRVVNVNSLQGSCLEKFNLQRILEGYNPWGHKQADATECMPTFKFLVYSLAPLTLLVDDHLYVSIVLLIRII